jgi:hypothetical protein
MLLLVALLWVPVSVWLAFTGVLLWASVPFSVVTVLAVLVWLRAEARADRPHASSGSGGRRRGPRADSRTTQARVAESSDDAFAEEVHVDVEQVILSSEITQVIHHSTVTQVRPDQVAVSANDSVFDIQAVATGPVPVVQTPAEELPPGSWSPVPVPKPTYVLKAKAEPRYTESGIPADVFDTPEFAEEAEELDERARFARRAASQ